MEETRVSAGINKVIRGVMLKQVKKGRGSSLYKRERAGLAASPTQKTRWTSLPGVVRFNAKTALDLVLIPLPDCRGSCTPFFYGEHLWLEARSRKSIFMGHRPGRLFYVTHSSDRGTFGDWNHNKQPNKLLLLNSLPAELDTPETLSVKHCRLRNDQYIRSTVISIFFVTTQIKPLSFHTIST